MALEQIEKIKHVTRVVSAEINEEVIEDAIPNLQTTFAEISPRKPSKMQFYRQTVVNTDTEGVARWNILGKFWWYLSGVYATSPKRGELIVNSTAQHVHWLRRQFLKNNLFRAIRIFYRVDKETTLLLAEAREAYVEHDYRRARIALVKIQENVREMQEIMDCEQMPASVSVEGQITADKSGKRVR